MLFADKHKKINTFLDTLQQNVYFSNIDTPQMQPTYQNYIKNALIQTNAKTY